MIGLELRIGLVKRIRVRLKIRTWLCLRHGVVIVNISVIVRSIIR